MVDLPDGMPASMAKLPVNKVGYPVPWFVWFDKEAGDWDFRILRPQAIREAMTGRCWICGNAYRQGELLAFVIGPMCAVNHTSAEPPSHLLCARWAVKACPFLARPDMRRREVTAPHVPTAGVMIERNPGVTLVWKIRPGDFHAYLPDPDHPNQILFDIGEPRGVEWYAEGRTATRAEILTSIETGLPALDVMAQEQGPDAVAKLERRRIAAEALIPAA